MKKTLRFGVGLALAALLTTVANASLVFDWSYTGSGVTASGTLTTTDTTTALTGIHYGNLTMSGYQITGITGQRNGVNITGLAPNTHFPANGTVTVNGTQYGIDDALDVIPSGVVLDIEGLVFYAGGIGYDLAANGSSGNATWGGGSSYQQLPYGGGYAEQANGDYIHGRAVTLTITPAPVPEPTTMIAGALLLLPFGASTLRMLRKSRTA
jgi:hypothetical protein